MDRLERTLYHAKAMFEQTRQLTVVGPSRTVAAASAVGVPALIVDAGEYAARGFPEFFAATICNKNTRVAYLHAVYRFFPWCERHRIGELAPTSSRCASPPISRRWKTTSRSQPSSSTWPRSVCC